MPARWEECRFHPIATAQAVPAGVALCIADSPSIAGRKLLTNKRWRSDRKWLHWGGPLLITVALWNLSFFYLKHRNTRLTVKNKDKPIKMSALVRFNCKEITAFLSTIAHSLDVFGVPSALHCNL